MIRVAVLQIDSQLDPDRAASLCASLIERAVIEQSAQIVVFPELLAGADELSPEDSELAQQIAARAAQYGIWVFGALTVRSESVCLWVDPSGQLATRPVSALEQTGAGSFSAESALISTPHGMIGLCAGREALRAKVPRALAVAGASLVCSSQAVVHERTLALRPSARAAENQIFVAVSARRPQPLGTYSSHMETLPPEQQPEEGAPVHSQVIGPSGRPLALTPCAVGAVLLAELALELWEPEQRPTPTMRRPELVRSVGRARFESASHGGADLAVAAQPTAFELSTDETLARACEQVRALALEGVALVTLPALFCFDSDLPEPASAAAAFPKVVRALAVALRGSGTHVVTSLVEQEGEHFFQRGVLIGQAGIVVRQDQLRAAPEEPWGEPGTRIQTARLPWGTLAICVAEDALLPEFWEHLSLSNVDLVTASLSSRGAERAMLTLPAAAEEGNYAVVAALRGSSSADSDSQTKSLIVDPSQFSRAPAGALRPSGQRDAGAAAQTNDQTELPALRATIGLTALREARLLERLRRSPDTVKEPMRGPELARG